MKLVLTVILILGFIGQAHAQDQEIQKALKSSFSLPLEDLFAKDEEEEWKNLFDGLSVTFGANHPLTEATLPGEGTEGDRTLPSNTYSMSLKYSPISYWFASVSFVGYQFPELQQSWNPDFTYCFGYNDWHPYTLSLTYCNYGGNRLNPGEGERYTDFDTGGWTLGWKFPLPKKWQKPLLIDPDGSIGCNIGVSYVRSFVDAATNESRSHKRKLSLGCKYTIWGWWYLNFAVNYYPIPEQKQPWDPDFTYGFGYFDWHPGTFSLQYNNYSGNRFPWNDRANGTGTFKNGSISLTWSWVF